MMVIPSGHAHSEAMSVLKQFTEGIEYHAGNGYIMNRWTHEGSCAVQIDWQASTRQQLLEFINGSIWRVELLEWARGVFIGRRKRAYRLASLTGPTDALSDRTNWGDIFPVCMEAQGNRNWFCISLVPANPYEGSRIGYPRWWSALSALSRRVEGASMRESVRSIIAANLLGFWISRLITNLAVGQDGMVPEWHWLLSGRPKLVRKLSGWGCRGILLREIAKNSFRRG